MLPRLAPCHTNYRSLILVDKGIEIPSDLQGVVYTGTDSWEFGLLKELKSMGYSIDFNKMDI